MFDSVETLFFNNYYFLDEKLDFNFLNLDSLMEFSEEFLEVVFIIFIKSPGILLLEFFYFNTS